MRLDQRLLHDAKGVSEGCPLIIQQHGDIDKAQWIEVALAIVFSCSNQFSSRLEQVPIPQRGGNQLAC